MEIMVNKIMLDNKIKIIRGGNIMNQINTKDKNNIYEQIKKAQYIYDEIVELENEETKEKINDGCCIESETSHVFNKYSVKSPIENVFNPLITPTVSDAVLKTIKDSKHSEEIHKKCIKLYSILLMCLNTEKVPIISTNIEKLNAIFTFNQITLGRDGCKEYLRILQKNKIIIMYYTKNNHNRTILLPYEAHCSLKEILLHEQSKQATNELTKRLILENVTVNWFSRKNNYRYSENIKLNLDTLKKFEKSDMNFFIFYCYLLMHWHDEKCETVFVTVSSLLKITAINDAYELKDYLTYLQELKIINFGYADEEEIIIKFLEKPPFREVK